MNKVTLMDKVVHFTYSHAHGGSHTTMEGSVAFDPANTLGLRYDFWTGNWRVKYAYAHGFMGRTVFEPTYDVSSNALDLTVSKRLNGCDSVKASYQSLSKDLGLEWKRRSKINGSFKVKLCSDYCEKTSTFMCAVKIDVYQS